MARDITKREARGKELLDKHPKADLRLDELSEIIEPLKEETNLNNLFKVVTAAFYIGVAVGNKIK